MSNTAWHTDVYLTVYSASNWILFRLKSSDRSLMMIFKLFTFESKCSEQKSSFLSQETFLKIDNARIYTWIFYIGMHYPTPSHRFTTNSTNTYLHVDIEGWKQKSLYTIHTVGGWCLAVSSCVILTDSSQPLVISSFKCIMAIILW